MKKLAMVLAEILLMFFAITEPVISGEGSNSDTNSSGRVVFSQRLHDVNYDLNIDSAIEAGKYNDVADRYKIENYFISKYTGIQSTDFSLVQFDQGVTYEEVLKDLAKKNLRPAELTELLAFGAQYPGIQLYFDVIALGSTFDSLTMNLETGKSFKRKHVFHLGGYLEDHSYDGYRNAERFISTLEIFEETSTGEVSYGKVSDPYYGYELFLAMPVASDRFLQRRK